MKKEEGDGSTSLRKLMLQQQIKEQIEINLKELMGGLEGKN